VRTPSSNSISLRGAAVPPTGWAVPRSYVFNPYGSRPSTAALTMAGARKARLRVMRTARSLQRSCRAISAVLVNRRAQPGPGLGPHGPALRSFSDWADDLALAAAGGGRPGQIEPLRLGIVRLSDNSSLPVRSSGVQAASPLLTFNHRVSAAGSQCRARRATSLSRLKHCQCLPQGRRPALGAKALASHVQDRRP
jgi:hypothetical protein